MSEQKRSFQKLSPTNNAPIIAYKDAIDFVFEQTDLRNIGITGAYGAGKTSIIKTYENVSEPKKKFLYISLAHFEEESSSSFTNGEKQKEKYGLTINVDKDATIKLENSPFDSIDSVALLEGKIINQLVHQIEEEKIPKTSFLIKRQNTSTFAVKITVGVVLFVLAFLNLLFFNNWVGIINSLDSSILISALSFTTSKSMLVLDIALLTGLFSLGFFKFVLIQKDRRIIKKLSLSGNDIEVFSNCEESYFDKYLNDVLYLFENATVDAIVFEDIDRHNCVKIFQRLREINELVNRRLGIDKTIRFIYLLRDDIFSSSDRTKFFDFIIPIVPIVDSSNSYELLFDHFKTNNLQQNFDDSYISSISLYIDDMRILKNICNEYEIYAGTLREINPDSSKLFSLILYKNLFPKDFILLQRNKGYLNYVISKKNLYKNRIIDQLKQQIATFEKKISDANKELANSKLELKVIYDYYEKNPGTKTVEELAVEKASRVRILESRINNEESYNKQKISETNNKLLELGNSSLADIVSLDEGILEFSQDQEENISFSKGASYFSLLKYLIKSGSLDENYHDYITVFYPNSISYSDKTFLMNVLNSKEPDYNYNLNNSRLVIQRLGLVSFSKVSALNFNILDSLLSDAQQNNLKLMSILNTIKRNKCFEFLVEYYTTRNEVILSSLTCRLAEIWSELIREILNISSISEEKKSPLIYQFLILEDKSLLKSLDADLSFSSYISKTLSTYVINRKDIDNIYQTLKELNIRIEEIDTERLNAVLFDKIYSDNLYAITLHNINVLLLKRYHLSLSESSKHQLLSLVFSKPDESLSKYVSEQLDTALAVVLSACEMRIQDDLTTIAAILNSAVEEGPKLIYMSYITTQIQNLNLFKNVELWPILVEDKTINITPVDILNYFFLSGNGLDGYLIRAINRSVNKFNLSYREINKLFVSKAFEFFNAVIQCNALKDEKYREIILSMKVLPFDFTLERLKESKLSILIRSSLIKLDKTSLALIRNEYSGNLAELMECYIDKYTELVKEDGITISELLLALSISKIEYRKRIELLKNTSFKISIKNMNYPPSIEDKILENNFDDNDLPYLLLAYDSKPKLSTRIKDLLSKHSASIVSHEYPISYNLLLFALQIPNMTPAMKLELVANSIALLSFDQSIECLKVLHADAFISVFNNKKPIFTNTKSHMKILRHFQKQKWIKKVTAKSDGTTMANGCYQKYRLD